MRGKTAAFAIVVFAAISVSFAQSPSAISSNFENQYVRMTIPPGWTVDSSKPPLVKLIHGNYILTIDPIHTHSRAFGSLEDIAIGLPSVEAVMREVEGPWPTSCAQPGKMIATSRIQMWPLYTDDTKRNIDYGCKFPSDGKPAWFGSYSMGAGPESEYIIALAYDTNDVNALPKKDSPELRQVLSDVDRMMRTCELKPPIVISRIEPQTAAPGAMVTLYGSGLDLKNFNLEPRFVVLPDLEMAPTVAPDGRSMKLEIPPSRTIESCDRPGHVYVDENCVPAPPSHPGVVECPRVNDRHPTFCGVPFPAGAYQIQVVGEMVRSNRVVLTVTAPKPAPVSISLLYPNVGVLPGDTIRVSGTGFTAAGNTVTIGSAVVSNVPSPDGSTLEFEAPLPAGDSLVRGQYYFEASVANEKGKSNAIAFSYHNAN
jgi:hypothetical protein